MWILIAEDEPSMGEMLRQGLEERNHTVTLARDGLEALSATGTGDFDIVVLDVMMPGMDGMQVAKQLRRLGKQMPILMLTARDAPADIVQGLDAGADDYLVKPFAFDVFAARLRSLSRRAAQPAAALLRLGDLVLDPSSREVTRGGRPVNLTATEFRFLEFLLRRPGRAVSRSAIIDAVWGFDDDVEQNTVDTYVKLLRDKIDCPPHRKLLHTVRGYGYILREQP